MATGELFDATGEPSPSAAARPVEVVRMPRAPERRHPDKPSIEEQFTAFHAEHPEVLDMLVALAEQARDAGFARIGMKRLYEVLRWQVAIDRRDEDFMLNNNFTSRYARLLIDQRPDLGHLFETRKLRTA